MKIFNIIHEFDEKLMNVQEDLEQNRISKGKSFKEI